MSTIDQTNRLIRDLARQTGAERSRAAPSFERTLLLVVALSLAVAVALVLLLVGVGDDLAAVARGAPFHHKIASTLLLAGGGGVLVRNAARPDGARWPLIALLPGIALLALGGVLDGSGLSVIGRSSASVPACVATIVLLSLPGLAMIIGVVRTGAAVRPTFAGAAAGLLAGALGAAAYALACRNDGGLFVAIWYSAAIVIVAAVGAAAGRRALAW